MSPPRARRAPGDAPWEITESEGIDFSVGNRGGSPDEELRRKCNNLILLQCPRTHPFQPGPRRGKRQGSQLAFAYAGDGAAGWMSQRLLALCLHAGGFRTQHFRATLALRCHMFHVILHDIHPLNTFP